jgi:hypothetical protein
MSRDSRIFEIFDSNTERLAKYFVYNLCLTYKILHFSFVQFLKPLFAAWKWEQAGQHDNHMAATGRGHSRFNDDRCLNQLLLFDCH